MSGLESDFLRLHWLKKDVTEYNQDMRARVHSKFKCRGRDGNVVDDDDGGDDDGDDDDDDKVEDFVVTQLWRWG